MAADVEFVHAREASREELADRVRERLDDMLRLGTTTVEVASRGTTPKSVDAQASAGGWFGFVPPLPTMRVFPLPPPLSPDAPAAALEAGADLLVVGRPIRDAKDPAAAARAIVAELEFYGRAHNQREQCEERRFLRARRAHRVN